MINRDKYLNQLMTFKDKDLIKVITGVRRCGKSTLLDMMREHLEINGVPKNQLLSFKMESMEYDGLTYKDLYNLVRKKTADIKHPYLFFDELQEIEGWERAINSLRVDIDCDIYITGSNAYLLSSELSTMLSGRYVEIEMLPLVFSEYLDFQGAKPASNAAAGMDLLELNDGSIATLDGMFEQFRKFGGMPYLSLGAPDIDEHMTYCKSLYDTVVVRDILERDKRRDRRKLTNSELLKRICAFLSDNIGNENSINSITGVLKSQKIEAANETIAAYITALCESYMFYPVKRYDIKGKENLKTGGKQYIVDVGLRNYLMNYHNSDQGRVFENIIFQQLLFDGFNVSIGKLRNGEVDFVATRGDKKIYIQVTEDMTNPKTMERELKPLQSIRDSYPKIIITMKGNYPTDIEGIKILNVADFLLHGKEIV